MESFSKALNLSGVNPTTSIVLWLMIIFLVVLIAGLSFAFIKQIQPQVKRQTTRTEKKSPKGF